MKIIISLTTLDSSQPTNLANSKSIHLLCQHIYSIWNYIWYYKIKFNVKLYTISFLIIFFFWWNQNFIEKNNEYTKYHPIWEAIQPSLITHLHPNCTPNNIYNHSTSTSFSFFLQLMRLILFLTLLLTCITTLLSIISSSAHMYPFLMRQM